MKCECIVNLMLYYNYVSCNDCYQSGKDTIISMIFLPFFSCLAMSFFAPPYLFRASTFSGLCSAIDTMSTCPAHKKWSIYGTIIHKFKARIIVSGHSEMGTAERN